MIHVMNAAAEMAMAVIGIIGRGISHLLAGEFDLQHAIARGVALGFKAVIVDAGIIIGHHLRFFRRLNFLRRRAGGEEEAKYQSRCFHKVIIRAEK